MQVKNNVVNMWKKIWNLNRKERVINYCEMMDLTKSNSDIILLDVRSIQEYDEYHLTNAINIPYYELRSKVEKMIAKDCIIIVYCQSGIRSKKACKCLESLGYCNLYALKGGLDAI